MKVTHKLAVLAAALGLSSAATAQSSVTLYGLLDVGMQYNSVSWQNAPGGNISGTRFGTAEGQQNGNRFGIRGVEDIGNGNRITFALESGFNLTNGTQQQGGRLFGRQAWLGIENNSWGYVRAGRQYNVASEYFISTVDPFLFGFGQASSGTSFGAANVVRYDNMLRYQTPNISGVQASVGYSFNTGLSNIYTQNNYSQLGIPPYNFDTNNNVRALTTGVTYKTGPVALVATYDLIMPAANVPGQNTVNNINEWTIGGAYDFRVVKVSAAYGQTRNGWISGMPGANVEVNKAAWGGGAFGLLFNDNFGANSYLLAANAPIDNVSKVFASAQVAAPIGSMPVAANQSIYSVGYQYDFTKRTNAYAFASYANNYAFLEGAKSTVVGVGMRHQF